MATAHEKLLRIGQLAAETGKTARAIHFYEELGLLEPATRTAGGFRLYSDDALLRLHWIDRLQELGFSLTEVKEFLSTLRELDHGPAAMVHLRTFYALKLKETRAALTRLQGLEHELRDSLDYLSTCHTCAAETLRSACRSCSEPTHEGVEPPPLVAAVHDPA